MSLFLFSASSDTMTANTKEYINLRHHTRSVDIFSINIVGFSPKLVSELDAPEVL